ncbi:MAG: hypothetical protein H6706_03520 [Myxococcales bacterium]|nr:hypothetical protein [Myxococcales bacterium]
MCPERLAFVLGLLALGGCGDPLVSAAYRGRPLLALEGPIEMPQGAGFLGEAECDGAWFECFDDRCDLDRDDFCPPCDDAYYACVDRAADVAPGALRLGLFWARPDDAGAAPAVQHFALVVASFPARYQLSLYTPPPAEALQRGSASGQYGLGLLLVYLDTDADDRFTPGRDPIVGGAPGRAILYSPGGVRDADLGAWAAGFHRLAIGPTCEGGGGLAQAAIADDSPMALVLSADPGVLQTLLLDPDCDGALDDFAICLEPEALERLCAGQAPVLCDLCLEALDR